MSAPSSYDRVLSALRRLFPFEVTITRPAGAAPAVGDSAIGRELATLAWMLARATDRVEVLDDEIFASTATESIARWEKVFGVASNTALTIGERRDRVLSSMRRSGGLQPDRLRRMLYSVLGLDSPDDVELIESSRADIEAALTYDTGAITLALPGSISVTKFWPSTVDDMGVRVYLKFDGYNGSPSTATLTSPMGTAWTIIPNAIANWYEDRTTFLGEPAGGTWTLYSILNGTSTQIQQYQLLVSNDTDSRQIYNFYAYRDPLLSGTPDIAEAQRVFNRSALAHMTSYVVQSILFLCDSPYSLMDRDPLGE